jgi:hypothetical protein
MFFAGNSDVNAIRQGVANDTSRMGLVRPALFSSSEGVESHPLRQSFRIVSIE